MNICFSLEMLHVFTKLSKYNQKISKNLIQLSAIFYVANKEFYLPINKLTKAWDQTTDLKYPCQRVDTMSVFNNEFTFVIIFEAAWDISCMSDLNYL